MDPLFGTGAPADQTVDPNIDYADQLIGEGKRYKDLSAAARALVEKEAFIERLKVENAAARAAIAGEKKLDDFFDKLKSTLPPPGNASTQDTNPGESQPNQSPNSNSTKALSPEDVLKLMEQREQVNAQERNLAMSVSKVKEVFGANYQSVMAQKAADLNMSPETLVALAKTQPQAFLKLVEADKAPSSNSGNAPPRSSVNTTGMNQSNPNVRNKKHYDALRKEVGDRKFFAPAIQNQLHRDMLEQREAFFS